MLKLSYIASAAEIAVSDVAFALELPRGGPPPPVSIFTFYVGVNAGDAFSQQNNRTAAFARWAPSWLQLTPSA